VAAMIWSNGYRCTCLSLARCAMSQLGDLRSIFGLTLCKIAAARCLPPRPATYAKSSNAWLEANLVFIEVAAKPDPFLRGSSSQPQGSFPATAAVQLLLFLNSCGWLRPGWRFSRTPRRHVGSGEKGALSERG